MSDIKRKPTFSNDLGDDTVDLRIPTHRRCYIIVEPDPLPDKAGSLFIPEKHQEQREHRCLLGTVRQVPEGHYNERGRLIRPDVAPGDRVVYDRNSGAEGDPLGYYGVALIPEEAILLKEPRDDRDQDGEVEKIG